MKLTTEQKRAISNAKQARSVAREIFGAESPEAVAAVYEYLDFTDERRFNESVAELRLAREAALDIFETQAPTVEQILVALDVVWPEEDDGR